MLRLAFNVLLPSLHFLFEFLLTLLAFFSVWQLYIVQFKEAGEHSLHAATWVLLKSNPLTEHP